VYFILPRHLFDLRDLRVYTKSIVLAASLASLALTMLNLRISAVPHLHVVTVYHSSSNDGTTSASVGSASAPAELSRTESATRAPAESTATATAGTVVAATAAILVSVYQAADAEAQKMARRTSRCEVWESYIV
jgi:hypothetical protein